MDFLFAADFARLKFSARGAGDDQRGRRGESFQRLAPERFRSGELLLAQPVDVIAIWLGLRWFQSFIMAEGLIERENVLQHRGKRAGVQQQVRKSPNELIVSIRELQKRHSQEGWLAQVEAELAVLLQEKFEAVLLFLSR